MSAKRADAATGAGADEAPAPARGRPRSAEAHQAILDATLTVLDEIGYGALTIEGVAARAGVGKTTIYRRWPSKLELAVDAVAEMRPVFPPEDTGSLEGDFAAVQRNQIARVAAGPVPRILPRMLAESMGDTDLHRAIRRELIDPIRAVIAEVLQRGVERGELRPDLDLELATDMVHGTVVYRILLSQGDLAGALTAAPRILDLMRVKSG